MSIKVFIVDDHALVRTGFKLILGREVDMEVVGEAESGEEALPLIRKLKPDVVLCDLHLPGISGLEVTERVVRGDYGSRVIVVSDAYHLWRVERLAKASGFDVAFEVQYAAAPADCGRPAWQAVRSALREPLAIVNNALNGYL